MVPSRLCNHFLMRRFLQRAVLIRMITNFLPVGGDGAKCLLPAFGLPKKTYAEFMVAKWYDMHITFNALKGVCEGSGDQVLQMDDKLVDEMLTPILGVLDEAVATAVAECNEEMMDLAHSAMVKLIDAES